MELLQTPERGTKPFSTAAPLKKEKSQNERLFEENKRLREENELLHKQLEEWCFKLNTTAATLQCAEKSLDSNQLIKDETKKLQEQTEALVNEMYCNKCDARKDDLHKQNGCSPLKKMAGMTPNAQQKSRQNYRNKLQRMESRTKQMKTDEDEYELKRKTSIKV